MTSKVETESRAPTNGPPSRFVLVAFLDETMIPIELPREGALTVGRSSSCAVVLDHPSVSREHARITIGPQIAVDDLGSRNGTRVRGVPLAARQPTTLHVGDVVECGDATLLVRALAEGGANVARTSARAATTDAYVIGVDCRSLSAPHAEPVNLGRRGALRRVLLELAEKRIAEPGSGLSVDALLGAGWPGEKMSYEAGVARVYTTIQRLRALGLQAVLITRDDGYLLDPNVPVRIEEA